MSTTKDQRRAKMASAATDIQAQIDEWIATMIPALTADIALCDTEIAAIQVEIDELVAVANRTAVQNTALRSLRRDKTLTQRAKGAAQDARKAARFGVKTARFVLLLDGGHVRDSDVTGSDG